jgi:uncharacterized protein (DUF2164 family)
VNQLQQWGPVAVIVAGYVLGFYFQNRRIDDLRDSMGKRMDDLRDAMNRRFDDTNARINVRFDAMNERIDRLEHPLING